MDTSTAKLRTHTQIYMWISVYVTLPEVSEDERPTGQGGQGIVHQVVLVVAEPLNDFGAVFGQHEVLKDEEGPPKRDLKE